MFNIFDKVLVHGLLSLYFESIYEILYYFGIITLKLVNSEQSISNSEGNR